MAYKHGAIVLIDDPYKDDGKRPFLVVSNERRPYHGDDYTLAAMTTTEFEEAVTLTADEVIKGDINIYPSYIKPWSLHEFYHWEIQHRVAQVSDNVIRAVAERISHYHSLKT